MREQRRPVALVVGLALVAVALLLGPGAASLLLDWLWYGEIGGRAVLVKLLLTRLGLGLAFGLGLFALTFVSLAIARRYTPAYAQAGNRRGPRDAVEAVARRGLTFALLAGSLVLGLGGGGVAASRWDDWLRFRHGGAFGEVDPLLRTDAGFYVFQLPFLQFTAAWLFGTLLLVTAATALFYYAQGAVTMLRREGRLVIPAAVRTHLSVLLGLVMLAKGWDYWLDRYGLLLREGPLLVGATYADHHARLFALNLLVGVAVVAALGFFVNARARALWLPGLALAVMAVAGLTVGAVYPALVQRFVVAPDEQAKERPYIQHHLEATRRAYGLADVETKTHTVNRVLAQADLAAERPTLDNVRLWDYRVLSQTYHTLQRLRDYYNVSEVDIDRYTLGGRYRQVMLAPRELQGERLNPQQRSWVNRRLQFTHGYGLLMSAVNEADSSGQPTWFAKDLPLALTPGLEVSRPQIYYGVEENPAVVAPSNTPELDYLTGSDSVTTSYQGAGGIPIGGGLRRLALGMALGEWNLVISDQIRPDSRLLIRRGVVERVRALAPFLTLDSDPYLVVHNGGLIWIQDAYTLSAGYPYSARSYRREAGEDPVGRTPFNYLRNAVKATVDAYTGEVRLYAFDDADPVLRCYRAAFPNLIRPAADLPPGLRAHLRYPEDMFNVQALKWTRFHVTSPDVFYARSDVWDVPAEQLDQGDSQDRMQAYYVIMRLPGEEKEEFALILPFKTQNGTTMPGWLVARCDGEHYGQLRLYRFPTNSQHDAPEQVDSTIQADPVIAPQVSLMNQQGSKVRYGNLLVLPVGGSILYVKPLYLEAASRQGIPGLKHVILAEKRGAGLKVVMRPTLSEALAALTGGSSPTPPAEPSPGKSPAPSATGASAATLAAEADRAFSAAEAAQRAGDWAEYGRRLAAAREALRRLRAELERRP
jgi:uncharacterized membrane protein (UPF0182 family)